MKSTANLKDRDCSRQMRSGPCVTEAENPEVCHVPLNRIWSQWETTCSILGSSAALFVLAQLLERSHRVRLIAPCGIHLARRMLHMFGTMTPHYSIDWDRGRSRALHCSGWSEVTERHSKLEKPFWGEIIYTGMGKDVDLVSRRCKKWLSLLPLPYSWAASPDSWKH